MKGNNNVTHVSKYKRSVTRFSSIISCLVHSIKFRNSNGWIPEGVGPPIWVDAEEGEAELNDFSFLGYDSNDSQVVKETDATKLSEALERGLKYISNVNIKSVKSF